MNYTIERKNSGELVCMGGDAGVWAVELFSSTDSDEIIIFVLNDDGTFRK
jgi:hypothetical protein